MSATRRSSCPRTLLAAASLAAAGITSPLFAQSAGDRLLGIDVSDWQGTINWTTVHKPAAQGGGGKDFTFIRASRGGTTGTYNEQAGTGALSQRYDDTTFQSNITNATAAGMFAGAYHFARPDITSNNGADEANHFLQDAGPWMKPGYLLPVLDLEVGESQRTSAQLSQFAVDFANRIKTVTGVYPLVYINQNYADYVNSTVTVMDNWVARWPNQSDPDSIDVQNGDPPPSPSTANVYGVWNSSFPTIPNPQPWNFWQYASTAHVNGIGGGTANVDVDVAHGGQEFLKDFLVPALWTNDASGQWTTIANWNTNADPSGLGPTARLPGVNDTVILDHAAITMPTITLSSGTQSIRKLYVREPLAITGGSLNIGYVPVAESTPISAEFSSAVSLSGTAALSVHTLQVDAAQTFTTSGGIFTFNTLSLVRGPTPAKLLVGGNVSIAGLSGATATILGSGSGTQASLDLNAGTRTITVADGAASIDLAVNVPIKNGMLTKSGLGTMSLGATNTLSGTTTITDGVLQVTANNQLGSTLVTTETVTTAGSAGHGGTLRLTGNVNYNLPMTIGGAGLNGISLTPPGIAGAIDSASGTNTWAGNITLNGNGTNGSDPTINQISAASDSTLTLSGMIQDGSGVSASLAKSGDGDVVLTGSTPNTYSNLTRAYGGRLIIEKDGALGAAGSATAASGNTFQLPNSNSVIAFRAPQSAPGFDYSTDEWINTDGYGANGLGQIDNLAGSNTFAGNLGLSGPTIAGNITSSLGVSTGSLQLSGGIYARGTTGARIINKLGAGTLIITGDSSSTPTNTLNVSLTDSTFNITAGVVELRGPAATATNLPGVTTWNVSSGATLVSSSGEFSTNAVNVNSDGIYNFIGGATNISSLAVNGGAVNLSPNGKTLRVNSVSVIGNGKINLSNNQMIVDYTGASPIGSWIGSTYTDITELIASGRNDGHWNGSGIVTNQSNAITPSILTTIGIADAGSLLHLADGQTATWNGQTVDATSVLVMYTYGGDANLDGQLNGDDYFAIDSHVNLAAASGYANGDFNLDGHINGDDYFILDSNINQQSLGQVSTADGLSAYLFHAAPAINAVPEPTALGLLFAAGLPLLRRHRRRSISRAGLPLQRQA